MLRKILISNLLYFKKVVKNFVESARFFAFVESQRNGNSTFKMCLTSHFRDGKPFNIIVELCELFIEIKMKICLIMLKYGYHIDGKVPFSACYPVVDFDFKGMCKVCLDYIT